MRVLVTGAAGFIGYHLSARLLADGHDVIGVDSVNDYYDPKIKEDRLKRLTVSDRFAIHRVDISDARALGEVFESGGPQRVVNLAAQAGVRYSLTHPGAYVQSNLVGFANILECCRRHDIEHLVYASSSSVYGANEQIPFSVDDNVDHPVSLYAASKKSNELMAHAYSHLFELPTTGLRFFTVYGPWGRPDMALFLFTDAILAGRPIDVFNEGRMVRDFTYVDDIVEGVVRVLDAIPGPRGDGEALRPGIGTGPYRVFNIGNDTPIELMDMIAVLERSLGRVAEKRMLPMQPGDVRATHADVSRLREAVGFEPATPLAEGIERFVKWFREYYGR